MNPLDHFQDVLKASLVFLALLVAAEAGFRGGRPRRGRTEKPVPSIVNSVQAAMLGLVGLLLAFSLSMAETRFTVRRRLITDEANAIGTAWLRAGLINQPAAAEARVLLARYADERVAFYDAGADRVLVNGAVARAGTIQHRLWARAEEAADAAPTPVTALYVASLNDVFDRGTDREALLDDHVPLTLKLTVLMAALVACATTGVSTGLTGRRQLLPMIIVPLMLGIGLATMLDLDQPRAGFIRTGQVVMLRLRDDLRARTPTVQTVHP